MEREMAAGGFEDEDAADEFVMSMGSSSGAAAEDGPALVGGATSARWRRAEVDPAFSPATSNVAFQVSCCYLRGLSAPPFSFHTGVAYF